MTRRLPPAELSPASAPERARSLVAKVMAERATFLAFIRRRVRSGADAEDIFQQALIRAAERAEDLREADHARAWFYRILRGILADHHARWVLREAKLTALAADRDEATPEEVAVCACSLGQLERLRPEYAEILRRVDIGEESLAQVAAALDITRSNATVRLHRARKALREQLQAFCGTDSMRACLDCACND